MYKIIKIAYLFMVILLAALIFSFSSQTGKASGGISEKVTDVAVSLINIGEERINPSHSSDEFQSMHTFVRKAAHFSIYAALGFCAYGFLRSTRLMVKPKLSLLLAQVFCFLYACSDEIHQGFVAERGPSFTDVIIDSAGSLFGIVMQLALISVINAIVNKKSCRTL